MDVIGNVAFAAATKCTGEATVLLFPGEQTVTPVVAAVQLPGVGAGVGVGVAVGEGVGVALGVGVGVGVGLGAVDEAGSTSTMLML